MSERYIKINDNNFADFLKSQYAVLVLGKSDCGNCYEYDKGISEIVNKPEYATVSFGKVVLDEPGSFLFRKNNPWISKLEYLPYLIIYKRGQKVDEFAASNVRVLEEKLQDNLFQRK